MTSNTIMKISKLRSICLPSPQPTMTTNGELSRAVWIEGPRQWKRAKLIWLSLKFYISGYKTKTIEVYKTNHASSMAVKCSAAFSTRGTRIRPIKLSGTPRSLIAGIFSTRKTADRVTKASATTVATKLSSNVSFGRLRSLSPSSSRFSSFSSTSSKIL